MSGFFTSKETQSASRPDGKVYSCISCGLYKGCETPRMEPFGGFKKQILVIGENPDEADDRAGRPWQGAAGKLLHRTFRKFGIDLFEDCLSISACHCHIPEEDNNESRPPTNYEVECCRKTTLKIINDINPHLIIVLGKSALFALLGHRWKKGLDGIEKWRGWTIPDQDFHCWICPTYHPKELQSDRERDEVLRVIWEQDLKRAFDTLSEPLYEYKEPTIKYIENLDILKTIDSGFVAFDYETTGLKPHAAGHQIVCCSVAVSEDLVYVFMMPRTRRERKPFTDLLSSQRGFKMAHNMKFEETWSVVRLHQPVRNWMWDSMQAAHILDNRPGVSGLKFQTYVNFGVVDYDSEVSPYLSAVDDTNANSLNRVMELVAKPGGAKKLMKYCAYDSINEYRLAMKQRMIIMFERN